MPEPDKNSINWEEVPVVSDEPKKSGGLDIEDLASDISTHESRGNYKATNNASSAAGKYQFLWGTHGDSISEVTGVKSKKEFLNNPDAQEKFFKWHVENNIKPVIEKLRDSNEGGYSDKQLAKLIHFKGPEGAREWLEEGVDKTTANNSSIDGYIGKPEGHAQQTANSEDINWDEIPVIADDPQKKSPDGSASGLATNSATSQDGSLATANNQPAVPGGAFTQYGLPAEGVLGQSQAQQQPQEGVVNPQEKSLNIPNPAPDSPIQYAGAETPSVKTVAGTVVPSSDVNLPGKSSEGKYVFTINRNHPAEGVNVETMRCEKLSNNIAKVKFAKS